MSAKRIAEEFHIPAELLAKILQRLAKKKLIVSHNGPKGGYVLARAQAEITVGQVVRALEGPVSIVSCMTEGRLPAVRAVQPAAPGAEDPGQHQPPAGHDELWPSWPRSRPRAGARWLGESRRLEERQTAWR